MQRFDRLFKDIEPLTDEVIDNIFDIEGITGEEFIESVQEVLTKEELIEEVEEKDNWLRK